jgi:hypothetical protein
MQKAARMSAALRLTSMTPWDCTAATPLALKGFSLDEKKEKPPDQGIVFSLIALNFARFREA